LRQFLREGMPWRSLRANTQKASGSTLRRALDRWAQSGLLVRVHALLVAMLRGDPDLILDTCSVRAKRGGDLTGPNPTDRGKRGTKYHVAITADGVPVACAATAASVNDTLLFERLFLAAWAVLARIRTVFADKGYDAERHRDLCRRCGVEPRIHKRGQPHGSGLGQRRWPVERSLPGCWRTGAWHCATIDSASSSNPCSRAHVYSWLQAVSLANFENRL
jgi:transposase